MPISVVGKNSNNSETKIDTSPFVQKPYLKAIYLQSSIEENEDMKNQFRIKKYLILRKLEIPFVNLM